jgi:PilZ domain
MYQVRSGQVLIRIGCRANFAIPFSVLVSEGVMSATKRVIPLPPKKVQDEQRDKPVIVPAREPALRILPLLRDSQPRRFARVPTHAVGAYPEHREYPRATLKLPMQLRSVNNVAEDFPITLVTRDISSTGVYFLCPKSMAKGTAVELDIVLVSRPMGRGNVVIATRAHVQRIEPAATPGWYGIAASFDDVEFDRDDRIPSRFLSS